MGFSKRAREYLIVSLTNEEVADEIISLIEEIEAAAGLGNVIADWGQIGGSIGDQNDLQAALDNKQDSISANNNQFLYQNNSGTIEGLPGFSRDTDGGGQLVSLAYEPNGGSGSLDFFFNQINLNPITNSPDRLYRLFNNQIAVDTQNDGFSLAASNNAISFTTNNVNHQGLSDLGYINFLENNSSIGNGTDPIDFRGFGYAFGFGSINANVNLTGPLQGYGFQPTMNAAATFDTGSYVTVFYDFADFNCSVNSYSSANFSPTIANISNNNGYTGLNIFPTIDAFTGNASVTGVGIGGTYGAFNENGSFAGVRVNPTIDEVRYAAGLDVNMNNVTPYLGVQSTLTEQDITFTFIEFGNNNNYTIEYEDTVTAGNETVTLNGTDIVVAIESGVTTATQVKAAWDAIPQLVSAITATITGTAGDAQTTFGPTNFANGESAGNVYAANLVGNVSIDGSLSFTGALSIGKLTAFDQDPFVDGGGLPTSVHSLISSMTIGDNDSIANADMFGLNTAALIQIGDNSAVTTSFVGVSAIALPAVITMGVGATIDQVAGATFAASLDATGTGGTITNLDLCRAIAIPNGVTTVTNLRGYKFDLPFGSPGTTTWGFYESPGVNNYLAGNLLVGGTAGSDDTVTNSSVALEIKSTTKAFMNARMDSTQRDALTAVNGMQIYNTTTNKLQVYAGGAWVDLH